VTVEACGWDSRLEMMSHIYLVTDMERIEKLEHGRGQPNSGNHTKATSAKVCVNALGATANTGTSSNVTYEFTSSTFVQNIQKVVTTVAWPI